MYRIVKLYRPQVGTLWWVQKGNWIETCGAMGIATGRPKRRFVVDWEKSYRKKSDAEAERDYHLVREANPLRKITPPA